MVQQNGGNMTLIIGIITTIITLLIVALEVMIGYERGIRKNLIRAVMLIIVAILTLLITPSVVLFIIRKLILTNHLYDYLYSLTGVSALSYGFVQESAVNMFMVFLNPFVYVVLFWILKLITFGIYLLIDRYIMKRRLTRLFPSPTRKSSIGGAILGGFYAILIGAIFFMPVSAYSELLQHAEQSTTLVEGTEGAVSELVGNENYRMAVSYRRTPSYYFYKYTGAKFLGDALFTSLSEKETEAATVSVEQYIPSMLKVSQAIKVLQADNSNLNTPDIGDYLSSFHIILEELAPQTLIAGTDQEKLALMKELMMQSEAIQENPILQAITTNLDYESIAAMQQDIKTLEEASDLLREKDMLSDLLSSASELSPKEMIERLDDELILQIADLLYSMNQADMVVPIITEKLLELLIGSDASGSDALNQIENFGDTKQDFIEVCESARQLAYLMNNTVSESEAKSLLKESLRVIRNSRLINEDMLRGIERILQNKLTIYRELNQ